MANVTRKYQKHSHHQHILELPDTYIGSTKTSQEQRWVYDAASGKMSWRSIMFNPGLYKIFDEIIVNARDEFVRSTTTAGMTPVKRIDVTVENDEKNNLVISVENDGDGIPIDMDDEQKVMIPEMIFGQLLTSGNYDKQEQKIVGGKNGYGQKVANIFSQHFAIDLKTPSSGKHYTQTWTNNMFTCEPPVVKT